MLNVKKMRTEKHVSKYMLSKLTGITRPALTKIENGGDVKLSTLYKIAEALGVDVTDLFERGGEKT